MSLIPVNLATEDEISEAVLRRVLRHVGRFAIGTAYRRGGFGYLKRTISGWNHAAKGIPFVVLTDLDRCACPPQLLTDWLTAPRHPNLVFRVAVREVEAWLLADKKNLAQFLFVPEARVPPNVETLPDPKAVLIGLARRSRSRAIRERLVPRSGTTAKQGPDYNACLVPFVGSGWDIDAATAESSSLRKAVNRLATFHPIWPEPPPA